MPNPLEELIDIHIREQKKVNPEYSQRTLAKLVGFDQTSVSKYRKKPSEPFLDEVLKKLVKDEVKREAKRKEIEAYFRHESVKGHSPSFDQFHPVATGIEFHPFVFAGSSGGAPSGFTPEICRRFFGFCHKHLKIDMTVNFEDAFKWVKDEHRPHNMVLNASETIPRSTSLYTFETPAAAPLNVVVSFKALNAEDRKKSRKTFEQKQRPSVPFIAVKDEIGYDYAREEFRISSEEDLIPLQSFAPEIIASKILEHANPKPPIFIGDELICLQVARCLNEQAVGGERGHFGFLFPLATLAVSRSESYAYIPTYKFGLFSLLQSDDVVIRFLKNSLTTMFDNDRFFIALRYKALAIQLAKEIARCIRSLSNEARHDLRDLHEIAEEAFQFPPATVPAGVADRFGEALAARVVRQTLRLNTQLIEADDELNLPWKPILELVRNRLLGPLPAEFRDLRFDQASLRCRVFPPFLSTGRKPGEADLQITNWGLFGPVLHQIGDLVNLEDKRARVPRADSERGRATTNTAQEMRTSQEDSSLMFERTDITVGSFDVPIRAYDQHFFRFPISLRLNAVMPGGQIVGGAKETLRTLFKTRAKVLDNETVGALHQQISGLQLIVLRFTAAHYLSTDWDFEYQFVDFDADSEGQLNIFVKTFNNLVEFEHGRTPLVLADELTCFRLMPKLKAHKPELLFEPLSGSERTRYFYSIGVERSEKPTPRSWWEIMQDALPVAIVKSRTEIIAEIRKLREELKPLCSPCVSEKKLKVWLDQVFCLDLAKSDHWSNVLLSDVWRSIIIAASDEEQSAFRSRVK